jgi:uncharacterized protein (DUF2336 family)
MTEVRSFLLELEDAVLRGSPESRLKALWHATDLLITGRYTDDQIWVFGEVIGRLAEEIEVAARCQLAKRLACSDNAPINIITKLAFDESIDVAGPVLRQSDRLYVRALVANARSKSQKHLLSISTRASISEPVTDVIVVRGDKNVVSTVAANHGARFSKFGLLHLIKRSKTDSILAEYLGLRKDIPRHLFHQLIAKASHVVTRKLEQEHPEMADQIQTSVSDVTGALHSTFGPASKNYFVAKKSVTALHRQGNLNEGEIFEYAKRHKFDEATVALSLLCVLPVDVVERVLTDKNLEMVLILAKAIDLSWTTTMSLLFLGAKDYQISGQDLDDAEKAFKGLNVETSRRVLKFYQERKHAAGANLGPLRLPQLHTSR